MPNEEFEKWLDQDVADAVTVRDVISKYSDPIQAAYAGFEQRQPEIDALKAQIASDDRLLKIRGEGLNKTYAENTNLRAEIDALKAEVERLRDAGSQAHSLLGELLPEATGDAEKEIYRVFDLLRYTLGIYAAPHDAAIEGETK